MTKKQKILLSICSVCVLLIGLDRAVGSLSEELYYRSKYGIFHRQIYCLRESEDEIMILGSSRAAHHYIPHIFEDSLHMSCYNAGSDGMCIYYNYAILASRIQRECPPKIVVYEVMNLDAEVSNGATFTLDAALDRLAPHYGEFAEIDSLFAFGGWKEKVKMLSKTYRYNSKLVQTIKCNFIPAPENRGYEALTGHMEISSDGAEKKVPENEVTPEEVEERKLDYVKRLILLCRESNIDLYFCNSPSFRQPESYGVGLIKTIAEENNIPFFDFGREQQFQNPQYFNDALHLNDDGAKLYTGEIARLVKQSH